MTVASSKNAKSFFLLALGLLVFLAWFLGNRGLNDPDEGRNANMASNFLKPGADWWEPRQSGYAHYDKPPLIYWTTALSLKVFGHNETAARLPSLVGAILALIGLGWTAGRVYGREAAWWALLICGTLGQFWLLTRFLTLDMMLTGWCALAIGAWAESRHRNGDWRFWTLSLFFWTLAWWTKATAALVPLLGFTVSLLIIKDKPGKNALRPLFLLLGMLVLGSVWYVRMISQHGELVDFFFIREMKGRVTGHVEGRKGPFYYYAALCFVAWLPWWPMALRAAMARWKKARPTTRQMIEALGFEGWIVVVGIVVFSSISSKLPGYTLPFTPWVSLLFARWILKLKEYLPAQNFKRWAILSATVMPAILACLVPFVPRIESSLTQNSTMREVASTLKSKGATVVYLDRHWPSMEFYFGSRTFYVLQNDPLFRIKFHQRTDDSGIDPETGEPHFYFPETWQQSLAKNSRENIWLVHYYKQSPTAFEKLLNPTNPEDKIVVGNFILVRLPFSSTQSPQKF